MLASATFLWLILKFLVDAAYYMTQDGKPEALERSKKFATECYAQPYKENTRDDIYGASFLSKISPWLAMGSLSPRFLFKELSWRRRQLGIFFMTYESHLL